MAKQGDPADLRLIVAFFRSLRKWTQEELSQASGVDRGLISDYELGKKAPTQRTLERLAEGVGLPYSYVDSLLPLFRLARREVEKRPASGESEKAAVEESCVEEEARVVGDSVQVTLVPYLIELEGLVKREGE